VAKLNAAINEGFAAEEMRGTITKLGGVTTLGSPEELGRFMAEQTEKWREVGRKAGVRVE
jgi:tripartite-type tricarboxylate transporter receptor subunit TctC